MKNITERLYIFTTWNADKDTNELRYSSLFNALKSNNRAVVKANGRYNGANEPSFVLTGDNNFEEIIKDICATHKQECFMVVYPAQGAVAELVYNNGVRKDIGKFTRVSKDEAEKAQAYTELDGVYYVVK